MHHVLEKYLSDNFKYSDSEISDLVQIFTDQQTYKGECLINEGDICSHLYFVAKGCVRTYFINIDGKETTRYLAMKNQFISNLHSFINQSPSNEYICSLESSELLAISYIKFRDTLSTSLLFKDLYIKQLEKAYTFQQWRLETFLKMNASQRYEYILNHKPVLIHRLSNKILASYLGITEVSLSRLKSNI